MTHEELNERIKAEHEKEKLFMEDLLKQALANGDESTAKQGAQYQETIKQIDLEHGKAL